MRSRVQHAQNAVAVPRAGRAVEQRARRRGRALVGAGCHAHHAHRVERLDVVSIQRERRDQRLFGFPILAAECSHSSDDVQRGCADSVTRLRPLSRRDRRRRLGVLQVRKGVARAALRDRAGELHRGICHE
jgi:hypothetical protein